MSELIVLIQISTLLLNGITTDDGGATDDEDKVGDVSLISMQDFSHSTICMANLSYYFSVWIPGALLQKRLRSH